MENKNIKVWFEKGRIFISTKPGEEFRLSWNKEA